MHWDQIHLYHHHLGSNLFGIIIIWGDHCLMFHLRLKLRLWEVVNLNLVLLKLDQDLRILSYFAQPDWTGPDLDEIIFHNCEIKTFARHLCFELLDLSRGAGVRFANHWDDVHLCIINVNIPQTT